MIKKSKKILFTVLLLAVGILLIVFAAGLAFRMKTEKPEEVSAVHGTIQVVLKVQTQY